MNTLNDFHPARFDSLRATTPQPVTWDAILEELTGETHAVATRHYREICRLLQQAETAGDNMQAESLKKQKELLKLNRPAFVASVGLEGGRTQAHVTAYSGFIMVDIDHIDAAEFVPILGKVKADVHSFLTYTTLSGLGIRVIARVEGKVTRQNFFTAWQAVNEYYARLTDTATDGQCKNATRMSVICHDPEALLRPDAVPFSLPELLSEHPPIRRIGRRTTARRAATVVRRLVEEEGIHYEAHSHNDYICRCLYWMNRFGVSQPEAENWALTIFSDYDHAAIRSTVRSCYAQTAEHGVCRLRDYSSPVGKQAGNTRKATIEEMENFIVEQMDVRMNLLTHQIEVRMKTADEWMPMNDTLENSLWCSMQRKGMEVDLFRLRTLLFSDFAPHYHPLKEYIENLPAWDGTIDYIGRMAAMVHTAPADSARFGECFRRWLVGMLAGALDERVVNHVILVFIGRQGSFKTSFMQNLLPPCLRRYYTSKTNSQRLSKDDLFTMTENLIVNFEEIDSMQRTELNQLKAMTTTLYVNERPAYGRNKIRLPHVASFCATGNNLQFLTDDTGNRRWLAFEVESIDNPWEVQIPYEGIYAQAYHLLQHGYRYWFQDKEIEELNRRNRRFEAPNPARELIVTFYRKPVGMEKARYLTASQIVARFGGSIRLNAVQVGRVLKELGFKKVHTRSGDFWLMVERSGTEIAEILPDCPETENQDNASEV